MTSETDIEELARRVGILETLERIRQLKYRYMRACDAKDVDILTSCFTRGRADIDFGSLGRFDKGDEFVSAFSEVSLIREDDVFIIFEMHHGIQPTIEIRSEDEASGVWTLLYRGVNLITMTQYVSAGEYEDEYVLEDSEWKIRKCHYRTLWTQTSPLSSETVIN